MTTPLSTPYEVCTAVLTHYPPHPTEGESAEICAALHGEVAYCDYLLDPRAWQDRQALRFGLTKEAGPYLYYSHPPIEEYLLILIQMWHRDNKGIIDEETIAAMTRRAKDFEAERLSEKLVFSPTTEKRDRVYQLLALPDRE